jgi:hypothetical protein
MENIGKLKPLIHHIIIFQVVEKTEKLRLSRRLRFQKLDPLAAK